MSSKKEKIRMGAYRIIALGMAALMLLGAVATLIYYIVM